MMGVFILEPLQTLVDSREWTIYIFMFGLISLSTTLLFFRSGISFLIQLVILVVFVLFGHVAGVGVVVAIIQISLSIYL